MQATAHEIMVNSMQCCKIKNQIHVSITNDLPIVLEQSVKGLDQGQPTSHSLINGN